MQAQPWTADEAKQLRLIARQLFRCDMHEQHDDYREHCGACVLRGYLSESSIADGMTEKDGPNYAGWARCYVQAGEPIPERWVDAFKRELHSSNKLYAAALARDIETWGYSTQPLTALSSRITSRKAAYQPKTGEPCHCRPGIERDNCPQCEGTGMIIDFAAIRAR